MTRAAAWLCAAAVLGAAPAYARLSSWINRDRMIDCGARSGALHEDRRVRAVAARVAAGESLRVAMRESGYIAQQATLLHVSGPRSNRRTARELARGACTVLARAAYRRIGTARRGRQAWIVLASAVALPAAGKDGRFARETLALVNAARASPRFCGGAAFGAAPPLHFDAALAAAALAHSRAMAAPRRFSHRGADGSTPTTRVRRSGYGRYRRVGENIAAGAMTPAEAVRGWLASPGHCRNIMDRHFHDTGIGFALDPMGPYGIYWTEDFAAR